MELAHSDLEFLQLNQQKIWKQFLTFNNNNNNINKEMIKNENESKKTNL